jgi:hypothetical protein
MFESKLATVKFAIDLKKSNKIRNSVWIVRPRPKFGLGAKVYGLFFIVI